MCERAGQPVTNSVNSLLVSCYTEKSLTDSESKIEICLLKLTSSFTTVEKTVSMIHSDFRMFKYKPYIKYRPCVVGLCV